MKILIKFQRMAWIIGKDLPGLEKEIRQELDSGLSPEDALEEWDVL